ncbi:MAG: carboxylating nicotinate-nucleotide diphosphorylase [Chloroflexi bacterium]|nr:carboxylating nicotinate-nucleotide diphosphorylase [Chloroflexota bacterium]
MDDATLGLIDLAIEEDRGAGDWTTRWTVPARTRARARIVAKQRGVIAGVGIAAAVYQRLDHRVKCRILCPDGSNVAPGDVVCTVTGPARAILTGERVALNFAQRLSGVATLTRRYVEAVAGTGCLILDTRKTTPGWRSLEKAAVRAGGGTNHRAGLFDMVLVKDNHKAVAGSLASALARVRDQNSRMLPVCVEVHSLDELDAALEAAVDRILLDNLSTAELTVAVQRARDRGSRAKLEASGNMTLDRVSEVAAAGVDYISVGALTHSAPALDLSLQFAGG